MFLTSRPRAVLRLFLAALFFYQAEAFAEEGKEKKKGKNDPEKQLAKAQALYEQGKYDKAIRFYQASAELGSGDCLDCLVGMFRASVARGKYEEAVQYAGAAIDAAGKAPLEKEDKEALMTEVERVFRQAFADTGGADADVIWGYIDVLAHLGKSSEIVRLAAAQLKTPERQALICAADSRSSLGQGEPLAVAEEVNEQLRGIGWDGPLLVSREIRRPRLRNRSYSAGGGARMAGVVDRRGFLQDVRVVRPPPVKISMDVRDKVRRALFDPATYQGRRIAVCYPFSVTLPGQIRLAQQSGGSGDDTVSPLYTLIQGFDSGEAILDLVEKVGNEVALPQRSALCAARGWFDELNQGLFALGWPGPFFDTEEVEDPVPQQTPAPEYTEKAREAEVEGKIVLSVVISETGRVVNVEVLERLPEGLSGQAVNAVRSWTFEPATREGKPIAVCREITVEFKL